MNREKPVKYCGSNTEESSLEAGEVCDVEWVQKHKACAGWCSVFQGRMKRGLMQGAAAVQREAWSPSAEWTRSPTRDAAHTWFSASTRGFTALRRRPTPSMHDAHGFKQPSWPIRGSSYRCIIHYCVKTRAVFNDLLTTVINSVWWWWWGGVVLSAITTEMRHKNYTKRAALVDARDHLLGIAKPFRPQDVCQPGRYL